MLSEAFWLLYWGDTSGGRPWRPGGMSSGIFWVNAPLSPSTLDNLVGSVKPDGFVMVGVPAAVPSRYMDRSQRRPPPGLAARSTTARSPKRSTGKSFRFVVIFHDSNK